MSTKLAWGPNTGVSLQTDHLIGASAHAPQRPMVTYTEMVLKWKLWRCRSTTKNWEILNENPSWVPGAPRTAAVAHVGAIWREFFV
ncbi:hypothetical protein TNCV_2003751 [Trichonephila clavipes]|nr:hypothetical protein TNCV_2003751 [Trichonephila clavipes]